MNTICGRVMIELSLLSSFNKHNMLWYYDLVYCFCSSVSKRNMWSYYDWVYCCCRSSVSTICGRIMIELSLLFSSVNTICGRIMIELSLLSSVSKHNMWSYYDSVVVVVVRQ